MRNASSKGFNKHRRPTKHLGLFAHRGRLLFLQKEETTSLNNGLNKKYIIKSEWKRNYALFFERPTGFMLCFSHVNAIFQFLTGLHRICVNVQKYVI